MEEVLNETLGKENLDKARAALSEQSASSDDE